ncbi:unnamed protein product [Camellia sinensis]
MKEEFPGLYRLLVEKNKSWRAFLVRKAIFGEWNLAFRRELYECEELELERLLIHLLAAPVMRSVHIGRLFWSSTSSGELTVAALYKSVLDNLGSFLRITKLIWLNYIPPKVQVFGWFAWKRGVKTKEFLQNLGIINENASILCVNCNNASESVNHVLICCPFVWKIWAEMLKWWDVQAALPGSVDLLFSGWAGGKLKKNERVI